MLYFISDTHFNHTNIIRYCKRPFTDINEMNEAMIANWNNVVQDDDIVYHLGDFGMGNCHPILERLKGRKILIIGSHDKNLGNSKNLFETMTPMIEIQYKEQYITLCHYCMRVWPRSHYNSWHLFGHSHGKLEPVGKSWDVGVDKNNFIPLSFTQIEKIMEKRPDNPGLRHSGRSSVSV